MPGPILFPLHGHSCGRNRGGIPAIIFGMLPLPAPVFKIAGVTRDSTGAALPFCVVKLFRTVDDQLFQQVISDASGAYTVTAVGLAEDYYVTAYLLGAPDVSGGSVNTLKGVV